MRHALYIIVAQKDELDREYNRLRGVYGGRFILTSALAKYNTNKSICERIAAFTGPVQQMLIVLSEVGFTSRQLTELRHDVSSINKHIYFTYSELP